MRRRQAAQAATAGSEQLEKRHRRAVESRRRIRARGKSTWREIRQQEKGNL